MSKYFAPLITTEAQLPVGKTQAKIQQRDINIGLFDKRPAEHQENLFTKEETND